MMWVSIHNNMFSSELIICPNKLECFFVPANSFMQRVMQHSSLLGPLKIKKKMMCCAYGSWGRIHNTNIVVT
jgi:hypothetical protein